MNNISASILSINIFNIKNIINIINNNKLKNLHLDVMDGIFVPNISFGYQIINNIRKYFIYKIEVHLMTINPDNHIEILKKSKIDSIIVHYETCNHLHKTINTIKKYGIKSGIAINPHTPIILLNDIICDVDIITIMSVNPGFGGQKFIQQSYVKITDIKNMIKKRKSQAIVKVDGGVNISNIKNIIKSGADQVIIGSSVFSNEKTELIDKKLNNIIDHIK